MNDEDHVLLSEKLEDQLKAVEWAREQNGWNPDTHWNHPKKGCFFIPHTEKGRTVCAVFFVLHQLIILNLFKISIVNMVHISFLYLHVTPPKRVASSFGRGYKIFEPDIY